MKKSLTFIIMCLLAHQFSFAQKASSVIIMDFVKIKNDHIEEALYYYNNNWKILREKALERGFIKSYQMLQTKGDEKADFDLILVTEYANASQYESSEKNFEVLIQEKGALKLMNDLKPGEFRENLFLKKAKRIAKSRKKGKKYNK